MGLEALRGPWRPAARFVAAALVLVSIAVTGASSLVTQGFPTSFYNPLREAVLPLLTAGYATRTAGHALGLTGPWAWLPVVAVILWIIWWIGVGIMERGPRLLRPLSSLGALGLAGLVFWVLLLPSEQPTLERVGALAWLQDHYEEDGGFPENQEDLRNLRELTRVFPGDSLLAGQAITEEARTGQWKEANRLARRWTEGRWKRLRQQAQIGMALATLGSLGAGSGVLPLWQPDDLMASLWLSYPRRRAGLPPPRSLEVPPKSLHAEPADGGLAEDRVEFPRVDPLEILHREGRKLRIRTKLQDLRLPRPPSPVVGTGPLTGIAPEKSPRRSGFRLHLPRDRAGVLDGPVGETAPGIEDPLPMKGTDGTGDLAEPALPAGPPGSRGVKPHELPVDGEPADEEPGSVGRMDEATIPSDPAEPRVDGDGLLQDRGAVHEDPAPKSEAGPEGQPDAVEPAP